MTTAPRARRCPSCEHQDKFHQPEGCWFTVVDGRPGRNLGCACARPFVPVKVKGRKR